MKRVFPQESAADSHSLLSNGFQPGALGGSRRVQTSAAMLGIALSFGTSASLLFEPESALAAEGPVVAVLPTAGSTTQSARSMTMVSQVDLAATTYYTVEEGDSLWHIAAEHEADLNSIKAANGIQPDEVLRVGQVLRVPSVIDSEAVSASADQVHRLALSNNVRGGVGGDLSVVFGEDLPIEESNLQDGLEDEAVARLSIEAAKDEAFDLNAALLQKDENTLEGVAVDAAEITVAALPAILPTSMPLDAVKTNPLEEVATPAEAESPAEVAETVAEVEPVDAAVEVEPANAAVTSVTPEATEVSEAEVPVAADIWQNQSVQAEPATAAEQGIGKPLTVAALGNEPAAAEVQGDIVAPAADTRLYRVKAGDTFWNIATRHGLSVDDLIGHNAGVQRPESLVAGSTLNIPVAAEAPVASASNSALARARQIPVGAEREAAIQDHLARLRVAANRDIDQEALKARILAVRQSLESAEEDLVGGSASLEYHHSADAQSTPALAQAVVAPEVSEGQTAQTLLTRSTGGSKPQWTVTDAANEADAAQISAVTTPAESPEALAEPAMASSVPEDLLAVAPMSPDVYRAFPELPVGEVVTPGMPILPASGEFLPEAPNRFNGYVWPAQGVLTSGYGWRWGRMHRGIDIAGPVGTPIMAAAPGVVVRSGWNSGGYGNLVDIRHADGSMTRYAHNSRLLVREGQEVRQGQQIAEMGSTGYSTGPHLHFEVHLPNSGTVNPLAHLPGR